MLLQDYSGNGFHAIPTSSVLLNGQYACLHGLKLDIIQLPNATLGPSLAALSEWSISSWIYLKKVECLYVEPVVDGVVVSWRVKHCFCLCYYRAHLKALSYSSPETWVRLKQGFVRSCLLLTHSYPFPRHQRY